MKGFDERTGLFESRYYANKYRRGDEISVKVTGGYRAMKYDEYNCFKKQK